MGKDITIVKGDRTVKLTIGAKMATANNEVITLDVPANVMSGRTMVPLRFISDALGEPMEWDALNQYVWIGSKDVPDVKDVAKLDDIAKFKPYYKGSQNSFFAPLGLKAPIQAVVLRTQDFPIAIGGEVFYRIDRAMDTMGQEYIRFAGEMNSSIGNGFFLMQKGVETKSRFANPDLVNFFPFKHFLREKARAMLVNLQRTTSRCNTPWW